MKVILLILCYTSFVDANANNNKLTKKAALKLPLVDVNFTEKKEINLDEIKPPKSSEIFSNEDLSQTDYEKTLDKQISELYKMTQSLKSSSKRGGLWLRLAELYVEKANILSDRIQKKYEFELQEFQTAKITTKPVLKLDAAKVYNRKSVQLYEWFLRDFPQDEKIDQALFFLGYDSFELGDTEKGTEYYTRLTKNYPNSKFTIEAHFALAEHLFDNEKWAEASDHYAFLLKHEKHNLYSMSLYKSAWCFYRMGRSEAGIKYLDLIIKVSKDSRKNATLTGKKNNKARLESEALKDLVVFYADTGNAKAAIAYFSKLSNEDAYDNIEKLAYYLSAKGNFEASREAFHYLIAQNPIFKKNFEFQYQIVQNYFFSKNLDGFKVELFNWIKNYNEQSAWHQSNKSDSKLILESSQLREKTLRNYILQEHQAAQNSRVLSVQQRVDGVYKLYLSEFSDSDFAANMHFYYAELLFDMQDFQSAAEQYSVLVNKFKKSEHFEKAAQNILLSYEKILPSDASLKSQTEKSLKPIVLAGEIEKFINIAKWYLDIYPNAVNAIDIKYKVGRLYYLTNNFDLAEGAFKEIIKNHEKNKYYEYSVNLLLDIYNLKSDYAGLEKIATELLKRATLINPKLSQEIHDVLEKANFKKAQDLEAAGKLSESAQQFLNFSVQYPKSGLRVIAFFNAAVNFERLRLNKEALQNYQKVAALNSGASADLQYRAKVFLAKLYFEAGSFEESEKIYTELAEKKATNNVSHSKYLYNSALISEIIGKTSKASSKYADYMKFNKNEDENSEIQFKIAEINRVAGLNSEALKNYSLYLDMKNVLADKKIQAHYWIFKLSNNKKSKKDISDVEIKIKNLLLKLNQDSQKLSAAYLAKIKLEQSLKTYEQLVNIQIPIQDAKQKKAVDAKLELMNLLSEQLDQIIKLESDEGLVSALNILGKANEHMATAFKQVPIPVDLSNEDKELYISEIAKVVDPMFKKSDESYKLAVERGFSSQAYNTDFYAAYNKASKKYPEKFYSTKEIFSEVQMFDWGLSEESQAMHSELNAAISSINLDKIKQIGIDLLIANSNDVEALNALAIYYYKKGHVDAALFLLNKINNAGLSKSATYNNLALIMLEKKQNKEAVGLLNKASELASKNYFAACNLAAVYTGQRVFEKALSSIERFSNDDRLGEDCMNNYAIALSANAKTNQAAQIYEKILKNNDSKQNVLFNYSVLFIDRLNKYKDGLELIKKIKVTSLSGESAQVIKDLETKANAGLK